MLLFDFDGVITAEEGLPKIAENTELYTEICRLTRLCLDGKIDYEASLMKRVEILRQLPVSLAAKKLKEIAVNDEIIRFIQNHKDVCRIVTANIDVWLADFLELYKMNDICISSRAEAADDKIFAVSEYVIDKSKVVSSLNCPVLAVGNSFNDIEMLESAAAAAVFCQDKNIPTALKAAADVVFYEQQQLCAYLEKYVQQL